MSKRTTLPAVMVGLAPAAGAGVKPNVYGGGSMTVTLSAMALEPGHGTGTTVAGGVASGSGVESGGGGVASGITGLPPSSPPPHAATRGTIETMSSEQTRIMQVPRAPRAR